MASPTILSTRPPKAVTSATRRSKQRSTRSLTCSGSRVSLSEVKPDQVGEQDRDDAPLVGAGLQRLPTARAEPRALRRFRAAGGADHSIEDRRPVSVMAAGRDCGHGRGRYCSHAPPPPARPARRRRACCSAPRAEVTADASRSPSSPRRRRRRSTPRARGSPSPSTSTTRRRPAATRKITGEGAFDFTTGHGTLAMDTAALGLPGLSRHDPDRLARRRDLRAGAVRAPARASRGSSSTSRRWASRPASTWPACSSSAPTIPSANLRFVQGARGRGGGRRGQGAGRRHHAVPLHRRPREGQGRGARPTCTTTSTASSSSWAGPRIPADAWVDGDDQIRRLRLSIPAQGRAPGASVVTQEFYDFGVKVEAVAPPADQVSDFAQLLQGAGQG